jgi:hypothetical protein
MIETDRRYKISEAARILGEQSGRGMTAANIYKLAKAGRLKVTAIHDGRGKGKDSYLIEGAELLRFAQTRAGKVTAND